VIKVDVSAHDESRSIPHLGLLGNGKQFERSDSLVEILDALDEALMIFFFRS
jgi:hypothetical protein